jgi:hypothetical protein
MEIQMKEAFARKTDASIKVEGNVDDSLVAESEKDEFIDRIFQAVMGWRLRQAIG